MPIDLQTADIIRGLRQRFGVRGLLSPTLDENISPVVVMLDLDRAPWRDNGQRFYIAAGASNVAAQFSYCGFANTSTDIAVIDQISFTSPANIAFNVTLETAVKGTPFTGGIVPELSLPAQVNSDQRILQYTGSQVGGVTATIMRIALLAGTTVTIPVDIAIQPTLALYAQGDVLNSAVTVSVSGRLWASR